jgi:thymidylate synthase (FAD)
MKIIKPSAHLIYVTPNALQVIEEAGRTCYKSESLITNDSAEEFVRMLIKRGHESVLEHSVASLKLICDRGVTHELVRHRLCSYSQESTRYCNYANKEIEFIKPCFWSDEMHEGTEHGLTYVDSKYEYWEVCMKECEKDYKHLIQQGATPQEARSVLPNSLKTEIVVTANFREWRHIFRLRRNKAAHPQMQEIMGLAFNVLYREVPVIFKDLEK